MVFDECLAYPATEKQAADSMRPSMRWARRSRDAHGGVVFGIVQGGVYPELRAESVEALQRIGFEGYAIGGSRSASRRRSASRCSKRRNCPRCIRVT